MNFLSTATPSGRPRTRTPTRAIARTLALGALLGVGSVGAGTTLVHAADDAGVLDFMLGDLPRSLGLPARAPRPEAELRERRARWISRPARAEVEAKPERPRWRDPAPRMHAAPPKPTADRALRDRVKEPGMQATPQPVADPAAIGQHDRTVCVRTCDGYLFPLANIDGRRAPQAHAQACAAACPGAETALYTVRAGQELEQAVSADGRPYRSLAAAFSYRTKTSSSCSCNPGKGGYARLLLRDATLQPGDAVARGAGGQVFTGRDRAGEARFVDFRTASVLSSGTKRELDRTLDVSRLERARAEFRRSLAAQGREPGRLRYASHSGGFVEVVSDAGFLPIRIVSPSPFR
ncbi:DUF2865 domain-containing protein [Methylobacterium terricola]|uniref:DUF2865 domain-containing protein n=1 Tax=Methylobacterium terricola TaxID=2583531 RepID=A0A5C4L844_9HYPH|nr:DUF2865 domain-containing protein [Methylobacterium terricola]TNC08235.1 DUF2865 domain-containing protein [Methylobacterium terricola]